MVLVAYARLCTALLIGGLLTFLSGRLLLFHPSYVDSAVFSTGGSLLFLHASLLATGGPSLAGLWGLLPFEVLDLTDLAPVASAAPLHVGALLGAGFFDLSGDANWAMSPLYSAAALALGGLWSRRLGPHREIWSWDVVEITAVDLLGAEVISEHLWQKRPTPTGVMWGGAEVRLFRTGLAASHHHLSSLGLYSAAHAHWQVSQQACAWTFSCPLVFPATGAPCTPPLRATPKSNQARTDAPLAASESSLVAWSLTVFAPSSGAIAAWGVWGGALYLWLLLAPLLVYFSPLLRPRNTAAWLHYPLIPLAHWFAAPLPWAPWTFIGREMARQASVSARLR